MRVFRGLAFEEVLAFETSLFLFYKMRITAEPVLQSCCED